jgi:HPt (histidine-containing phosphotransfer) domain-containing protein
VDAAETPPLLDERVLADLHEDFASTGDLDELATLIRNFLARSEESVAAVAAAVAADDAEGVRTAAHKLTGSSRTLGALRLGAVAARVESAAAEGDLTTARDAAGELSVVLGRTRQALSDVPALQRLS